MRWLLLFLLSPALAAELFLFTPEGPLRGEARDGVGAVYGLAYGEAGRFTAHRPVEGLRQGPVRACPQPPGLTARFGGLCRPRRRTASRSRSTFP
jgi:para-nitrobenzyl esterase